jgi:CHAD domain-containing protein
VVRAALAQIEANAGGVLASSDPEFLHQLRVGLRRLRSALRAFRDALPAKPAKRLARSLRKLSPKLGRARDWDVLVERLQARAAPAGLLARARRQRDAARKAACRTIGSKAFARFADQARSLVPDRETRPVTQFGAAALERAHRKLMKQARGIRWQDAAGRHAVRIRVKRLRYSCEFFAPAFAAKRASAYLAALKDLQDILGKLNDIAVGRSLMPEAESGAEEAALLAKLEPAWARLEKRPVFWRAPE